MGPGAKWADYDVWFFNIYFSIWVGEGRMQLIYDRKSTHHNLSDERQGVGIELSFEIKVGNNTVKF